MQVSIDRIEGTMAVLIPRDEDSLKITVPVAVLPPGSREGDILTLTLTPDREATLAARERVAALRERLKTQQG